MVIPLLIALLLLWLTHHYITNRKWTKLPSPGICLPVVSPITPLTLSINTPPKVGHMMKMVDKASLADPQASMWNMYKQHQKGGLLFLRFGPNPTSSQGT